MSRIVIKQSNSKMGCILRLFVIVLLFFLAIYFFALLFIIILAIAAIIFAVKYVLHIFGIRRYRKIFNIGNNRATYRYDDFDGEFRKVEVIDNQYNGASAFDRSYGAVPRFFREIFNKIFGRK